MIPAPPVAPIVPVALSTKAPPARMLTASLATVSVIDPDVAPAEDAPADAFFIPTNAKNKEDARKFLAFVARPDVQTAWNKTIGQLPINAKATVSDDKFIQQGFALLNAAKGLAQFYDRDAPAAMAKAGMEGFQQFMIDPSTMMQVLERLDEVQADVYK